MSHLDQYYAGTAIRINIDVKDYAGSYMDPDTSIKISVIDPAGTTKVDAVTPEKDETGQYHYNLQTAESDVKGNYLVKPVAVDNSYTALVKPYLFKLIGLIVAFTLSAMLWAAPAAAIGFYGATDFVGGCQGCVDAIDKDPIPGQILPSPGDVLILITSAREFIPYVMTNSGAAEEVPAVIKPDDETGDKRWEQIKYFYLAPGGAIRTGKQDGDEIYLQAYDVDGAVYSTMVKVYAGNSPGTEFYGLAEIDLEEPDDYQVDNIALLGLGQAVSAGGSSQTFTQADGRVFKVDPGGSAINFNPSGSFSSWWQITVINAADAAETITFDSNGLAQAVNQNERGIFVYDGSAWLKIYVGS